ncbi:MAG: SCO family protein [Gammaproteobacteria bacterium]|nr:SCO family protein [Gammaproteobacteria bacterium]
MPPWRTLAASAAVLIAGGAALAAASDGFQAFTTATALRVAVRAHPVRIPATVRLETHKSRRIALSDLRGKWLLVDFIYTRCPTYCVALGATFAQLQDRLAAPIAAGRLVLLSVSVDPDHDTPQRLAAYLARAHDRGAGWIAARPLGVQDLRRLERGFGVTVTPDPLGAYAHSVAVYLVDPQGRLVEILDAADADVVAHALDSRLRS